MFVFVNKLPAHCGEEEPPLAPTRESLCEATKTQHSHKWCTGTTQRDGMGREEGGGFRMGNTCIPVADSF